MDNKDILKHVDHTLLLQPSTWAEIKQICDDAVAYGTASVCIPPCYVKQASEYLGDKMAVCTVIGFPNGNVTTAVKEFETKDAIANGAATIVPGAVDWIGLLLISFVLPAVLCWAFGSFFRQIGWIRDGDLELN